MQKPSIGRIVHYTLTEADAQLIDQQGPQKAEDGRYFRNPVAAGHVYPAMVVAVFGGPANLKVFLDGQGEYWATSRSEGEGPGTWAWPPRV